MAVLTDVREERVAQNLAKGMSGDAAYTAAGYKPHRGNASRKRAKENIVRRVAELQGSTAKQITDVRDAARQHTLAAVETLVSVMEDLKASHSARVAAANGLLDRGHGKATQIIEAEISIYDSLSLAGKQALLAVLESLDAPDEAGDSGGAAATHH